MALLCGRNRQVHLYPWEVLEGAEPSFGVKLPDTKSCQALTTGLLRPGGPACLLAAVKRQVQKLETRVLLEVLVLILCLLFRFSVTRSLGRSPTLRSCGRCRPRGPCSGWGWCGSGSVWATLLASLCWPCRGRRPRSAWSVLLTRPWPSWPSSPWGPYTPWRWTPASCCSASASWESTWTRRGSVPGPRS